MFWHISVPCFYFLTIPATMPVPNYISLYLSFRQHWWRGEGRRAAWRTTDLSSNSPQPCNLESTLQRRLTATLKHGKHQFIDGRIPKLFLYGELATGERTTSCSLHERIQKWHQGDGHVHRVVGRCCQRFLMKPCKEACTPERTLQRCLTTKSKNGKQQYRRRASSHALVAIETVPPVWAWTAISDTVSPSAAEA